MRNAVVCLAAQGAGRQAGSGHRQHDAGARATNYRVPMPKAGRLARTHQHGCRVVWRSGTGTRGRSLRGQRCRQRPPADRFYLPPLATLVLNSTPLEAGRIEEGRTWLTTGRPSPLAREAMAYVLGGRTGHAPHRADRSTRQARRLFRRQVAHHRLRALQCAQLGHPPHRRWRRSTRRIR